MVFLSLKCCSEGAALPVLSRLVLAPLIRRAKDLIHLHHDASIRWNRTPRIASTVWCSTPKNAWSQDCYGDFTCGCIYIHACRDWVSQLFIWMYGWQDWSGSRRYLQSTPLLASEVWVALPLFWHGTFLLLGSIPRPPVQWWRQQKNKKTSNVKLRVMTLCIKNTKNNKSNNQTT